MLERLNFATLILGFTVTIGSTWLICKLSHFFTVGLDTQHGVQKFHVKATPRLGGLAIILGFCSVYLLYFYQNLSVNNSEIQNYFFCFLVSSMPVWMAGLLEDITHKVDPNTRLVMATVSAFMLYSILGVSITRTDVVFIDWIFSIQGGQLLVTLLVVAGFTHSVNIIDGFHGLSCGLMIIALCAISFMAWQVGDLLILQIALTSIFCLIGFFIFNWPNGNIFLGDAGAYLIGFWVVELGILIVIRNPLVSPMAPVVAGLLPLIETLFSMYRRRIVRKLPVNNPDALHLHTLVFRRLLYKNRANLSSNE